MYRPPPPRFSSSSSSHPPSHPPPPHRPFRPSPYHHLPPPPPPSTPHGHYVCDLCAVRGEHFKRDCPSLTESERRFRRERWLGDQRAAHRDEYQNVRPSLVHGSGFERNGGNGNGGGGGGGLPRGGPGYSQRSFDGGAGAGGPGPSHHRLSSNSSNAPNPNLLPYTHPRRPTSHSSDPPFPPPLFAPADCWAPGGDERDYELEQARRSRERRKDEEKQLRKERERERERSRQHDDEDEDEQEESASKRRSVRKRREREEEEREREGGRKRERRDSGFEEGTSSSRKRSGESRSRESSAAADRGRRPVLPENKIRARHGPPSERSPKKNRRPRSPRPPQDSHSSTTYGPPRPVSPTARPLLSRIDRAEELIQDESQVQKNTEESSKNAGTYTGPAWNTGFSHYNEKIGLRQRMGSSDNKGGASFRIPGDDDRSIPYDVIEKVDPMINLTHQRQHDAAHNFPSWPVGAIEGVNIPYRPWNPQGPTQAVQPPLYPTHNLSPKKSWKHAPREPHEGGYEIEYPSGKSSFIPADADPRPLPPLEHGRLLSRKDTYFPSYSDEEEDTDNREVPSRPSSDAGSSVSRRRRSSEEEEQSSKPEEPTGTEDWDTLSICQDDPVEYRSDEHQHDDDGGRGRGRRDDSPSDRSMASHSPSPRRDRDRDRSESPLGGRSPSNALGIDLRPGHSSSTLPPLGRVHTPSQPAQHSSRLHDDLPSISPSTLATLLPESVPVRRLMLSIARPPRLSSSRALGAFASSDSIQAGTNTPVLSPRMPTCTIADQGFKATLPDEEGKRRLLFVGGTGAGAAFWEGGDFGPMERERESEEGDGSERVDGAAVEEVKGREKKLLSGVVATSSSATVVPRLSTTSNQPTPLPTHPYRHSPYPIGPSNFNRSSRGAGGGGGGSTSTRWPAQPSSGPLPPPARSWTNRTQTRTPTNSSTSLPHHPPPPSTSTNEGRAGLPPSSDLDSSSQPNATAGYNKSPEELRARVVLSLKRQKKDSPAKPKPSIIIHSTSTSIVPANSFLGLYNDASTSAPAAESAPPTAASTSSTVPTLPSNVYLEILKHLGNQQHQPSDSSVKEWNDAVEGSKKVGVETAPSEPENSVVSQESEEVEVEVEEGEIDEMGVEVGVGMEGVVEEGAGGREVMGAGGEVKEESLDRTKFKASFRTIPSSEPAVEMEGEVKEEEEGVGMEMEG